MKIGFTYSGKDPKQITARDFLRSYIKERGILAHLVETEKEVPSPTVVINGVELKDLRRKPRSESPAMYPDVPTIAAALESHVWQL